MEGRGLVRKRGVFQPLLYPVVRDRKTQAGGRPRGILVVKLAGIAAAAELRRLSQRGFRVYLRVCFHLDSLHPQFDHPSSPCRGAPELLKLRETESAPGEFLFFVRNEAGRGRSKSRARLAPTSFEARRQD